MLISQSSTVNYIPTNTEYLNTYSNIKQNKIYQIPLNIKKIQSKINLIVIILMKNM